MPQSRAARIVDRIEALARLSEEEGALTRRYGSAALVEARDMVEAWLRAAGLATSRDGIGNLVGRLEGERPGLPALVLGSHLDTVRDAGAWDGPLGVLLALDQAERAAGSHLPFALEVAAFADEEGLRFPTAYLGSQVWAGLWDEAQLALADGDGVPLLEAVRAMGGDPARIAEAERRPGDVLAWCEAHIEQGTRLERAGAPLGVVTAIQGQTRCTAQFRGQAGHAGTTPMDARRDALLAAAEWALGVEAEARAVDGLVATVGRLTVAPGAANVIPGEVVATLDVRHPDDRTRRDAVTALAAFADTVASARRVTLDWRQDTDNPAVAFSPRLQELLARAVEETTGSPATLLASGAGHDAVPLSRIAPVSMLFVRCKDGISHNPAESVATEDVAAAVAALDRFVDLLAAGERGEAERS
jgi:allantoate deiminase